METRRVSAAHWHECVAALQMGRVVAIPTDTVYGIAALPSDDMAIDGIYAAKDRPEDKALPMLVASSEAVERIAILSKEARALTDAFWPGALTIVVQARSGFRSAALAADGTVAVRMPASELALRVLAAAGGVLAVTSANISGVPPALTPEEVLAQLDGRVDLVLDGGACPGGVASSVVRVADGRVEVLRAGALPREALEAALAAARGTE